MVSVVNENNNNNNIYVAPRVASRVVGIREANRSVYFQNILNEDERNFRYYFSSLFANSDNDSVSSDENSDSSSSTRHDTDNYNRYYRIKKRTAER